MVIALIFDFRCSRSFDPCLAHIHQKSVLPRHLHAGTNVWRIKKELLKRIKKKNAIKAHRALVKDGTARSSCIGTLPPAAFHGRPVCVVLSGLRWHPLVFDPDCHLLVLDTRTQRPVVFCRRRAHHVERSPAWMLQPTDTASEPATETASETD